MCYQFAEGVYQCPYWWAMMKRWNHKLFMHPLTFLKHNWLLLQKMPRFIFVRFCWFCVFIFRAGAMYENQLKLQTKCLIPLNSLWLPSNLVSPPNESLFLHSYLACAFTCVCARAKNRSDKTNLSEKTKTNNGITMRSIQKHGNKQRTSEMLVSWSWVDFIRWLVGLVNAFNDVTAYSGKQLESDFFPQQNRKP